MELSSTFLKHFESLKDPRIKNYNHRHQLLDILVIALLGTICGAEGWTEIVDFARAKQDLTEKHCAALIIERKEKIHCIG